MNATAEVAAKPKAKEQPKHAPGTVVLTKARAIGGKLYESGSVIASVKCSDGLSFAAVNKALLSGVATIV